MSQQAQTDSPPTPSIDSERVRLGRLARAAALGVPGVIRADPGPLGAFMTGAGGGERLEGVTCVVAASGGYEISLRLVCGLVPLLELGDGVRAAVGRAAAGAGLALDSVNVDVAGLCTPEAV